MSHISSIELFGDSFVFLIRLKDDTEFDLDVFDWQTPKTCIVEKFR